MTMLSKIIEYNDMQKILGEFARLGDRCYLENAGSTLYPQSLLQRINEDLSHNVYMNPHTDKYTRDCIEQIRYLILRHFNTDPSEYTVIFTSGTTQALKLVVESFQFANDQYEVINCGSFVYLRDNHTSVLGLREIAVDKNADVIHISHEDFLTYLSPNSPHNSPQTNVSIEWKEKFQNEGNTLLVYPAQSNFNGYKYPLNYMDQIRDGCLNNYIKKNLCKFNCNWYILLDAASYVASNKLDLSKTKPDFVTMSFYKIFGYPTGLGALIVRNSSVNVLSNKKYFGGGTVDIVLSSEDFHVKRQNICERFEDGTQSFLSIIALKHCFDMMHCLIPKTVSSDPMEVISLHTFYLAQDLYRLLRKLENPNGTNAAVLYHDSDFSDINCQGGIVTFNLLRHDGSYVGYSEFQHMADLFDINVRTGCFCNSGSCQRHLRATNKEMKDMFKAGHKCGDNLDIIDGKPTGAIRVSFAYYNTFGDIDKLMEMICRCFTTTRYKKPKRQTVKLSRESTKKIITKAYSISSSSLKKSFQDIEKHITPGQQSKLYRSLSDAKDQSQVQYSDDKIFVTDLVIFPIKSCGSFKVKSDWKIGAKGFEYDREWMIVKDNGVCLTQKHNSLMCLIKPVIDLKNRLLTLNFKGKPSISVPLETKKMYQKEASMCQSKVCSDTVKGYDCGDEVADWISEALEISYLRLIRQSDSDTRKLKAKSNDKNGGHKLNLSNQAQFLLINRATIRWLINNIKDVEFVDDIDGLTDRFRGNIIIDMDKELVETEWQNVIIGKQEFKVQGKCTRCQMVCIDQKSGRKTVEPLRTISELFMGKLQFGIYLTYIGPVDGSKDAVLKRYSSVKPFNNDSDVTRFQEWFFKHFLYNCCYCHSEYQNCEDLKEKRTL